MSDAFQSAMGACTQSPDPLRIVIYADSICPGNPFRPEKSRTVCCIYWTIVDWPAWLLQRSGVWPVLGFIRDVVLSRFEGGLSRLMCFIIRFMFMPQPSEPSFATGITLPGGINVLGRFAGFLADLAAHKELFHFKGAQGWKCCFECGNLVKRPFVDSADGKFVGLGCSDRTKFQRYPDVETFFIADELTRVSGTVASTRFEKLQKELGFRYAPHGLLSDVSIRSVIRPSEHCIRDWMHTFVGDGIANSEVAMLIHALSDVGITREHVQSFAVKCKLPKAHGKVHPNWLGDSRLKSHTMSSFASIMLSILPCMCLFLAEFDIASRMPDHVSCFHELCWIISLLQTGPERAMRFTSTLRDLIASHHRKFWLLYASGIKPKIHHAHHIVDGMVAVGKCLSCFVTERKHRSVKAAALHIFRNFEHTITANVITAQIENLRAGNDLFLEKFHIRPKELEVLGNKFITSNAAVTPLGELHAEDIVFDSQGVASRIVAFWSNGAVDDELFLEVDSYETVGGDPALRDRQKSQRSFIELSEVVAPCVWIQVSASVIRLVVPAAALFG